MKSYKNYVKALLFGAVVLTSTGLFADFESDLLEAIKKTDINNYLCDYTDCIYSRIWHCIQFKEYSRYRLL